jgi:hypothetical protein
MSMLERNINSLTDSLFYLFRNEELIYRFPDIYIENDGGFVKQPTLFLQF